MLLAIKAFAIGAWTGVTRIRLLALLYVTNLLLSAVVAAAVYSHAASVLAPSPDTRRFLLRYDAEFAGDFFRGAASLSGATGASLGAAAVVAFLLSVFLLGGVLSAIAEPRRPINFTTFFSACGRHFAPFLRVWVPAAVMAAALIFLNRAASLGLTKWLEGPAEHAAGATALGLASIGKTALFLLLFHWLVFAPIQLARTRCVVDDERGMLRGYLAGLALSLRNPLVVMSFSILFLALAAAIALAYDAVVERVPLSVDWRPLRSLGTRFDVAIPPALGLVLLAQAFAVIQQTLVLLKASAYLTIYRDRAAPRAALDPELVYASPRVVDAPGPRRSGRRAASPPRGYREESR